jgi:hypothetical protein
MCPTGQHTFVPVGHMQVPPEQTKPTPHAWPQLPQFATSVSSLTHAVPHGVPEKHVHVPPKQDCAGPQGCGGLQLPQCAGSPFVSMHWLTPFTTHMVPAHVVEHVPAEHTWPLGHWVQLAPQ